MSCSAVKSTLRNARVKTNIPLWATREPPCNWTASNSWWRLIVSILSISQMSEKQRIRMELTIVCVKREVVYVSARGTRQHKLPDVWLNGSFFTLNCTRLSSYKKLIALLLTKWDGMCWVYTERVNLFFYLFVYKFSDHSMMKVVFTLTHFKCNRDKLRENSF